MGYQYFREKLKRAFVKNRYETDPEKIREMIHRGEYVVKEIEALYMLRKYRTLKRRYYDDDASHHQPPLTKDAAQWYTYAVVTLAHLCMS